MFTFAEPLLAGSEIFVPAAAPIDSSGVACHKAPTFAPTPTPRAFLSCRPKKLCAGFAG